MENDERTLKELATPDPFLFNTWGDMKRMFLEKFFLASRTTTIKKEMLDKATFWRNSARVLGMIQQTVCHVSTSSNQ
ncbi:hypothetical protein CR513_45841, partial [Mucuna pruriens]